MKRPPSIRALPTRRRALVLVAGLLVLSAILVLLASPAALAGDVYSNIAPAPQVPSGGIFGRYPLISYELDEYFPAIKVGILSGVDVSGVPPMLAYFIAQVLWMVTAFLANALITVFTFCFSLDLLNGNGTSGSGALAPVAQAIHNIYAHTFGTPWLIAAFSALALWAMWKALVQRRYTETAGVLAVSLLYCIIGLAIVIQPQATIAPASDYANQTSTALLSLTSQGNLTSETQAKQATSDELFSFLVLQPWTVLEFGGIDHCVTHTSSKPRSVAVRPLSSSPSQEAALASELESGTEIHTGTKTCINNENKYAPHFLAYPFASNERHSEYEALEKGDTEDLPSSDLSKANKSYSLGPADEPAAEASGEGGQYQRLLLSIVILAGELGAFLLLGALAVAVILAAMMLLFNLAFAPLALIIGVLPGRGHEFFRGWLTRLAGYLLRKVIYSLVLVVVIAVCQALAQAASNLGWLLAFLLQAGFLWGVFLSRNRLTNDLLTALAGSQASADEASRLQSLFFATRLAQMAGLHRHRSPRQGRDPQAAAPLPHKNEEPTVNIDIDPPNPGETRPLFFIFNMTDTEEPA